jgi:hypothetical protein
VESRRFSYFQDTASTPDDTSKEDKEEENGEDKSNVFLWDRRVWFTNGNHENQ